MMSMSSFDFERSDEPFRSDADVLAICCDLATERQELAELRKHALCEWEEIIQ
jgi:hypothetical protein